MVTIAPSTSVATRKEPPAFVRLDRMICAPLSVRPVPVVLARNSAFDMFVDKPTGATASTSWPASMV